MKGAASVVLLGSALASCVINRATRPSLAEAAQGPSAPAVSGSPVVPLTTAADEDEAPAHGPQGTTWVRGYWHWDGVRYVWERGHWVAATTLSTQK